ncbi:MAG: NfeD family protein [Cellulomonadaceae bacterium]
MLTFTVIGGIGLVLVLLSLLVGEIFEVGDGALSGTGLGVGAIVFGAVGAITTVNGLGQVWTYVGSAVIAVVVMVVVQVMIKRLHDSEDGLPISLDGVTGVAMTDITPARGEVSLDAPQEVERRMAWSDAPIPEGSRIVVLKQSGSRVHVAAAAPAAPQS